MSRALVFLRNGEFSAAEFLFLPWNSATPRELENLSFYRGKLHNIHIIINKQTSFDTICGCKHLRFVKFSTHYQVILRVTTIYLPRLLIKLPLNFLLSIVFVSLGLSDYPGSFALERLRICRPLLMQSPRYGSNGRVCFCSLGGRCGVISICLLFLYSNTINMCS